MREALVKPEWRIVEKRDTFEEVNLDTPELRRCILVAEDRDTNQLYYDPLAEDFVLANGYPPQTMGIRGDAVTCFMAR